MTLDSISKLAAEFPKDAISWRAQSVTKDGTKAMALAYIDARDVMERLDDVCGPAGWQCDYPHASEKTVCRIGIKIGDEWIWKSNGAGNSDIEAEKGALSDAFKRAAVLWGIGRYLYALESPWVPCETNEWNGKKQWKRWTADPWSFVKGVAKPKSVSSAEQKRGLEAIEQDLLDCLTPADVIKCANIWKSIMDRDVWSVDYRDIARQRFAEKRDALKSIPAGDGQVDLKNNAYAQAMMAG